MQAIDGGDCRQEDNHPPDIFKPVILSGANASRSEAVAESKDPYSLIFTVCCIREFSPYTNEFSWLVRYGPTLVQKNA